VSLLAVAPERTPTAWHSAGERIPAVVLGGSGYVAGELLRLLVGHPAFRVEAVLSESRSGEGVVGAFPHLRGSGLDELRFAAGDAAEAAVAAHERLAIFSALPHGEAAARIDALLSVAEAAGSSGVRVVDLSADFRHRDPALYASIYGKPHAAPHRLAEFLCAVPELHPDPAGTGPSHVQPADGVRHVAHPGCFTTAATLALAPFVAGGWIEPRATVIAVTGSTGAGRKPTATTHHPERRSDLFAYSPLAHRHEPEMRAILAAVAARSAATAPGSGDAGAMAPEIFFVPHSGPFARGIHATISARLARPASVADLKSSVLPFYESPSSLPSLSPQTNVPLPLSFVQFQDQPPRLQSVVGTNRCDLSFAVRDGELVIFAALDNLVKGAAGGAVQWMNRLFSLPEGAGLALQGLGWL